MIDQRARAVVRTALELRLADPNLPPGDVLTRALAGTKGAALDFGRAGEPGHPFADLVCSVFDLALTSTGWRELLARAGPADREAVLDQWRRRVRTPFRRAYALRLPRAAGGGPETGRRAVA